MSENRRCAGSCLITPSGMQIRLLMQLADAHCFRLGRRPIFVDLDVGQGQISMPGSIGALLIERPASLDDGFSQEAPLVYCYGSPRPEGNSTLFNVLYTELAATIKDKLEINKRS